MAFHSNSIEPTGDKGNLPRKNRSFMKKVTVLSLFLIVTLCIGIGFYLKSHYSPDACVDKFIRALSQDDYKTIAEFVSCEGVNISEDSLKPFIKLYHSSEQFRKDIKNSLRKDLKRIDMDTYNDQHWIKLVAHRKFLVKTYTIQILPIYVKFSTNLNQVTLNYKNEDIIIDSSVPYEADPMLPGTYNVLATYTDVYTNETHVLQSDYTLCSDSQVKLNFNYSSVVLNIPNGYKLNEVVVNDHAVDLNMLTDTTLSPIFENDSITLSCINKKNEVYPTSFTVPQEFLNRTYYYTCDFNCTSMEFTYPVGLTVEKLYINGKKIKNLYKYVDPDEGSIYFPDLTEGTLISTKLSNPWGETYIDTYQVTKDSFTEYYHKILFPLSTEIKEKIIGYISEYYYSLYDALNTDDMETLLLRAEDDELANEFATMLENIQFDYDSFSSEFKEFEEDLLLEPLTVVFDSDDIEYYNDTFAIKIQSDIKSTTTIMNQDSLTPQIESKLESYSTILHVMYNKKSKKFEITAGYIDYNNSKLVSPTALAK